MGKFVNGINGPIVGKVGTVIGSSRNGKHYVKGPYKDRTPNVSKTELANRGKFSAAQYWLKPLLKFVREGFRSYKLSSGAFVAAKSYLLRHAFEGTAPDLQINPALVKVSTGDLPLPANIAVQKTAPGAFQFTWDISEVTVQNSYDQVMLLAYNIDGRKAYFNTTGQFRSTGADTLRVDPTAGKTWHMYAAFTSKDRAKQSESVYLGSVAM